MRTLLSCALKETRQILRLDATRDNYHAVQSGVSALLLENEIMAISQPCLDTGWEVRVKINRLKCSALAQS